jgi:hypothetical protein
MKHLKTFENNKGLEIGDYVAIKFKNKGKLPSIVRNTENDIFKVIDTFGIDQIKIEHGLPGWWIDRSEIIDYDKNKELLELRTKAKKYNL